MFLFFQNEVKTKYILSLSTPVEFLVLVVLGAYIFQRLLVSRCSLFFEKILRSTELQLIFQTWVEIQIYCIFLFLFSFLNPQ